MYKAQLESGIGLSHICVLKDIDHASKR